MDDDTNGGRASARPLVRPATDYPAGSREGSGPGPRSTGGHRCRQCGQTAQFEIEFVRSRFTPVLMYVCGDHLAAGTGHALGLTTTGQIVTTKIG